MKAYVLLEKGYEYDDNTYNETEGGSPKVIFFSKEDAEKKLIELSIKEYKEVSIRDYAYSSDEILNCSLEEFEEFNKLLETKYGAIEKKYSYEETQYKLHPNANEEESKKYYDMVSIRFYEIRETEVDTQSYRNHKIETVIN